MRHSYLVVTYLGYITSECIQYSLQTIQPNFDFFFKQDCVAHWLKKKYISAAVFPSESINKIGLFLEAEYRKTVQDC